MYKLKISFLGNEEPIIHEMRFDTKDMALEAAQIIMANGIGFRVDNKDYKLYPSHMIKCVDILEQILIT